MAINDRAIELVIMGVDMINERTKASDHGHAGAVAVVNKLAQRHLWLKLLAVALLVGVIVTVVVIAIHYNQSGLSTPKPLDLREYPVCTADNADETGQNDPTIRCMADEDIRTINRASFTPLDEDEADRMDNLLERHYGQDGADDYGIIQTKSADRIKALLDWQIFYSNTGNVGPYPDDYQMASTIDETPTSYVYTYYRNRPASAICQTSWSGPEYVIPHKIPSYSIELGGDCRDGDTYVENRGFTYVNTITINKDDMAVPLKSNGRVRVEHAPESTLIHDSVHYVDFGDRWCEATEKCRDYYDNR